MRHENNRGLGRETKGGEARVRVWARLGTEMREGAEKAAGPRAEAMGEGFEACENGAG